MSELSVHNHIIKDGNYVTADGTQFPGSDRETINKSLVPISYQKMHGMKPEKAFILHQINRTPVEYLSSLLRGRGHKNDQKIFKANRIGYILDDQSSTATEFCIDPLRIFEHNRSLIDYLSTINDHVQKAQQFIIDRFYAATQKIRDTPEILSTFRDQVRGVKINDFLVTPLPHDQLFFALDKTRTSSEGIVIEGWAFDALSGSLPTISIETEDGRSVSVSLNRHDRPDVEKVYPDAPKGCGFKITASTTVQQKPLLLIKSSVTTTTLSIDPTTETTN